MDRAKKTTAAALLCLAIAASGMAGPARAPERPTKQGVLWIKLEAAVRRIDAQLDGVMGVAILDLTGGDALLLNADEAFPTASSIKLPLLLELFHQEQKAREGASGLPRLADTYTFDPKDLVEDSQIMAGLTPGVTRITNRDLATFVVAVSDNAATNVLIDRVGMERVNAMLRGLGLDVIKLRRKMMDIEAAREGRENVATPREMARLLQAVYEGRVLNEELTQDFLKLLSTSKESDIPLYLPEDVVVANKPGSLEAVRTDSGIVFAKNRPFAISVMTAYDRDGRAAELAISEVAREAYRYFEMIGRTSEYGRAIPERGARK